MELSFEERRRIERQLANNNGATYMTVSSAEAERLMVARAVADAVIRSVAETPEGEHLIRVSATDVQTGERLATGFVNYSVGASHLRLVVS
ncbi:hypothetical protein [Streptomyces actuosus]|uniref:Uncharacterized protein n=2 Tax=Streptomyces TaxID=1883 RepID=A0A2U9NZY2_STRAS|nr:hypothetical protein [Streptomyces actuosus]AWT42584.1 hypothetical protein DMT42_09825 [Streptomyces actuosus]